MSRIKDLTGKRFGKLLVISRGENDNMNRCTWNCQCDCGTVVNVKSANLVSGGTTSCGCNRVESLVGKKYGRLKVISREKNIRSESGRSHVMYMCQCDCGNYLVVKAENLRSGNTKSCGCYCKDRTKETSKKHGLTHTNLYHVWQGMKSRCMNKDNKAYKNYGGRGITVCDEWKDDFQTFYDWAMNNGYSDGLTIDRIENDKGYYSDNCRWVTNKEQQRNKRNNFIVSFHGEEVPLSVVSEKTGIDRDTLSSRIKSGMSVEEAILYKKKEIRIDFNGENRALSEWSKIINVSYRTLYDRYRLGQSSERILRELTEDNR